MTLQKQYGIAHINSDPHGALIYVDGQPLLHPDTEEYVRTPTKALLIEGRRDITLKADGYKDYSFYLDIFPGVTVDRFIRMKSTKETSPLSMHSSYPYYLGRGDIYITSRPLGAYIFIDNQPLIDNNNPNVQMKTPVKLTGVYEGLHKITFSLDGYYTKELVVDVLPNTMVDANAYLMEENL